MSDRELALDALKYALNVAEAEEWNIGEQSMLAANYPEEKMGIGMIAVLKMRRAIAALESSMANNLADGKH